MPKQKRYANTVNRRKATSGVGAANRIGTRTPIIPTFSAPAGDVVTITLNQAVSVKNFPAITDTSTPTITVVSAVQTAPNVVVATFNAAPTVAITVPFEDPSIRNKVGGYLQPGSYTFPS